MCIPFVNIHGIVAEPLYYLSVCHIHHSLDFIFGSAILLHYRVHFPAVDLGILYGHLAHKVEVQFEHLPYFLVKSHPRKSLLHLRLNARVTRYSRFLNPLCLCCDRDKRHNDYKKLFHVILC